MDDTEFEALYRSSAGRLVGLTYAVCGDLQEAQDCVHEAFVRAWNRRRALDSAASPEAWLRVTAMRIAVSRWRKHGNERSAAERNGAPGTAPEPGSDHTDLVRAMRTLPGKARVVMALHYLCDLPVDVVAAQTGMPVNTVKSHLMRGRDALRRALAPAGAQEVDHA
jgi:RNA polymerase sigma-70 factor (ECF subfamily)